MLKKLLYTIKVYYWRTMYQWQCVDVHYFLRLEPHTPSLNLALNKANRYKKLLESVGEKV